MAMDLSRRPVLFALARQLAEAWPGDARAQALIAAVFRLAARRTHRAPCGWRPAARVALKGMAEVRASRRAMRWPCRPAAKP